MYLARRANVPRTHWLRPYPSYPANLLAPLIGGYEEALERMGYTTVVGNAVHFKLLDHDLRRGVADLMRLKSPAVCVECVREEGHIGAFWDMAAAVACTRHGRLAVEACEACGKPLAWHRPGMLRCRCNADIGVMTGLRADETLLDLMTILEAKFEHRSVLQCQVANAFPLQNLEAMPLFDLLRLIHALGDAGRIGGSVSEKANAHSAEAVRFAAGTLLDWPRNFVNWIDAVASSHAAAVGERALNRIFNSLFRRKPLSDGLRPMADALSPVLHTRRAVKGTAKMAPENRNKSGPDAEAGQSQSALRMAVLRLGISAATLALLRSRGTYQSHVVRGQRQRWRPDELEAFGQRLTALAVGKNASVRAVKLEALLGRKFRNTRVKAEIVEAMLQGDLAVVGMDGARPADLLLDANAAEQWVHETRLREGQGAITMAETAAALDLNPPTIPAAISEGLLETVAGDATRVTRASIDQFRERYIPIVQLAHALDTSAAALVRFVERHGMPVIRLKRGGVSDAEQPIMRRESKAKVEALWAENQAQKDASRRPRVHPESERLAALAAYLVSMKVTGQALPRRAGNLDKSKIARACGFERNEFYVRPKLARLLDDAVLDEQKRVGVASLKPIELLRSYLEERAESGSALPRSWGRPNRQLIASACGFDRGEFYNTPELVAMLDAADVNEQNNGTCESMRPMDRLRSYLAECERYGNPIPQHRNKPNRKAVAEACGFTRAFFDNNPEAARLLEQTTTHASSGSIPYGEMRTPL